MSIKPFQKRVYLASPYMHGDELKYMTEAFTTNWMSTVGKNIDEVERLICEQSGMPFGVALSAGTAALHMVIKLAGEHLYGKPKVGNGTLMGHKVFCSDTTFDATVNPVVYEGGEPVFVDSEYETWNMDPKALEKAFTIYPDVKLVVLVHLYGTPAKMDEILDVCHRYGALLIEDAAEAIGATYKGNMVGSFGDYAILSFNGNKLITGSAGGAALVREKLDADKIRKWSTQAREAAPWYQHEEIGYNYRMSNVIAGVVRGQFSYIQEHIERKTTIFERYKNAFKAAGLPVDMNPHEEKKSKPNRWLSCMIIDKEAMCKQVRSDNEAMYIKEDGKSCPTQILEAIADINAEGRPIWKPMHVQPIYRSNPFITKQGNGRATTNAYIAGEATDVGMDVFDRGLCLPSDINMTIEEQERIIEVVKECFRRASQ